MRKRTIPWACLMMLLAYLPMHAQNPGQMSENISPYQQEWQEIDSLSNQGLPQSALEKLSALYERAKNDNKPVEQAKAAIRIGQFKGQLSEDGQVATIAYLQEEETQAPFPVNAIFQSVLGEWYMNYLRNQIWRIRQRESTTNDPGDDIKTWSVEQLLQKSTAYYLASISRMEALEQLPIESFGAITSEGKNTDELRPTLFDFLAHRAIDHFSNDLTYITQPAYQFTINEAEALAPVNTFVNHSFETEDSLSFPYLTLQLLQSVLEKHGDDDDPAALIDANLKRLRLMHNKAVFPQKDSLYAAALKTLAEKYENRPVYAEILSQLARFKVDLGHKYQNDRDESYRWETKEAHEICQDAIEKYPESYGAVICRNLLTTITNGSLELMMEKVNVPVQPSLLKVTYKNISEAFVQVIRIKDPMEFAELDYEDKVKFVNRQRPVESWSQKLPDEGDYQLHAVELAVPVLDIGHYAVVVADTKRIREGKTTAAFIETTVSQLAYLHRQNESNQSEFVVVNRSSGAPISDVKAEFFARLYNRPQRKYELNKIGQSQSDENGFVHPGVNDNQYFRVKFSRGQDVLFLDNGYSNYRYDRPKPRTQRMVHFFLDRAIYRPGQTVYFKALLLEKEGAESSPQVVTNEKLTISLYDANGQEAGTLNLTTSDFGTANGTFVAPSSGLLGQMSLRAEEGGQHYFRVEEYKRPRFEVTFEPLAQQAQLGGMVSVTGKALGFAGDNVQDGQVTYRVVREVRYPWLPWLRRSGRFPFPGANAPSMEIANGQMKTAEDGTFEIEFEAIPDPGANKENQPAFVFTVYADVTDLTGETHSSEKRVQLAYLGLQADIQVPDATDRQDSLRLKLTVKNLDEQLQAVDGQLTIERLVAPGHPFLERYWDRPDYHVIDKETFTQQFPLFAYADEDQPQNWPVLGSLYDQSINTGTNSSLKLDTRDWPVGHYRVSFVTEDDKGQEIKALHFFQLYDREKKLLPTDQWLWTQLDQQTYEPQDLARLAIATSLEDWHLLYQVDRKTTTEEPHWVRLEKWLDMNEVVREGDRGNFYLKMAAVRYNRVFSQNIGILVPWSNKQLKIEYSTFRDKLRPGDEEEWQLKISGPKGEQVAAEMVAAMYDASLDQFAPNTWRFAPFPTYYPNYRQWQGGGFEAIGSNWLSNIDPTYDEVPARIYRQLDQGIVIARRKAKMARGRVSASPVPEPYMAEQAMAMDAAPVPGAQMMKEELSAEVSGAASPQENDETNDAEAPPVTPRTNLNETVFFFPKLKTDSEGNVVIAFTMNEALTRWKFMTFAHTTDLAYALSERELVTQKELMVLPSPPRFLREGDEIFLAAKVSNLSEGPLAGTARLELFDALSQEPIDLSFGNDQANITFETKAGGSAGLEWKLSIPKGKASAITYRITASAGDFSDGEESVLPVLTNRMLVTESKPLALNGGENKTFTLDGLHEALSSPTAEAHQLSLEFTSNPAWYAVQALPYLMEYPYECTEQIFNRYYANALASSAANQYPQVREVFNQWRDEGQEAMLSNLRKNEDLKAVLLEETPWVLAAKNEEEQKQNIGLLFDLDRMSREEENALAKLQDRQGADGSFAWFPGGRESWHMTQYIVQGIGRLRNLKVADPAFTAKTDQIALAGMEYLDEQLQAQYKRLSERVKEQKTTWEEDHLNSLTIHYLYTRSLFDIPAKEELNEIIEYYLKQAEKYWTDKGLYEQGLIALSLAHRQRMEIPKNILASLQERALRHDELGMYWKYPNSWFWNQLPIETHAQLIEVFSTLDAPAEDVNALKIWLLKNKQTNHWPTTTSTAAAVYALLNAGDNWLAESREVKISFPGWSKRNYADRIEAAQTSAEAGTGYFSVKWEGTDIDSDVTKIKVKNPNKGPAWGAAYWQYFEDMDKIKTFEETPLTLKKQLFLEKASDRGPVLEPIKEQAALKQGDKLIVRLELRVDRAMEYVHMKDTRAAGLEPINVLSQYHWQDGLGYYESPGDAATNFFMDRLPAGTYVFEYPVRVTYKGDFSNGITSIQCMYAPEFTSHSEGGRVVIE